MSAEDELIAKILASPQATEKPKRTRRKKVVTRDLDTWFFGGFLQELGVCSDPNCPDPREKEKVMTIELDGKRMCRYSFINGYGNEEDSHD
ncbi:MAG TPA: hypothetical protein VFV92_08815 [Candidatus Bathyarchaeia archaeon]|nr:hypothetical protein [Candidatus Bathyarchaeia archaeon]